MPRPVCAFPWRLLRSKVLAKHASIHVYLEKAFEKEAGFKRKLYSRLHGQENVAKFWRWVEDNFPPEPGVCGAETFHTSY